MTVHSGQLGLLTAPKIPANDPPHEIPNSPTGQPAGSATPHSAKMDLNKKSFPKQNTIQTFNIDV